MRKHMLGSSRKAGTWSPRFARSTVAQRQKTANDNSSKEVSRVTTLKRGRRSISLFYGPHVTLAKLLEADPAVLHWNTAALANADDMALPDAAHFFVSTIDNYQAIRVGGPFSDDDASSLAVRGIVPVSISLEKLARDPRIPVAEVLIFYRSQPLPKGFVTAAILALSYKPVPQTLGELQDALAQFKPAWDQILTLVGAGYVQVTLAKTIDRTTPITDHNPEGWR